MKDMKTEKIMGETTRKPEEELPVIRGELALLVVILINSLGVVLMLHSGSGISAISSVPYAFTDVFPKFFSGNLDLHFPGIVSVIPDDHEKEICTALSVQLCGRIRVQ